MSAKIARQKHERERLYHFWQNVPPVKKISVDIQKIEGHDIRGKILRLLRRGISDPYLIDGETFDRRHVLSVQEIQQHLKKEEDFKISVNALYFHLGILEEYGILTIVSTILRGKHRVAFYGRTSRIILYDPCETCEYDEYSEEFIKFLKTVNPEAYQMFKKLKPENYHQLHQERGIKLANWISKFEKEISTENIDVYKLMKFLYLIDHIHPTYKEYFSEIYEKLNLA